MSAPRQRGGQPGNRNGAKDRPWEAALRKIATQDPDRVRRIAEKLYDEAEAGNMFAVRELFERLDGKVAQRVEATGPDGVELFPRTVTFAAPPEK